MNESMMKEKLKENLDSAMKLWEDLVDRGGQFNDRESMTELSLFLKNAFEDLGMECESIDVGDQHPPLIVGEVNRQQGLKPILFSGHYDTVFPFASYTHPAFTAQGDIARGPGVLDMKGGIAISWLVIRALLESGFTYPLRIVFAGDEENEREKCHTIELLKKYTSGCKFAFNMETGNLDGSICIGRKGVEEYVVTVNGVSSHPGNFFERGANAIEEAARKIVLLQELTAKDFSYTVNVGTIHAGTVSNIIPDLCQFKIDIRFLREKDRMDLDREIRRICAMQFVPNTTTEVSTTGMLPPFETHEKEERLYAYLVETARRHGIQPPAKRIMGGASDAAYISDTDTPVLCSMGIAGENNHSPEEYAVISSFLPRAELLALAALDHENFK